MADMAEGQEENKNEESDRGNLHILLCCIAERTLRSMQQVFDGRCHRGRAHERDHLLELVEGL